ncbi:MAG TPA: enoyl-CoA hydratase-related protein [Solirubrobacterales bacterium]|jgi:2-(1,2-epoxy-1,2-dihydrophenyl)acetyl-CoA isomerase|nr:enoyl-CoA hydratase-related protein [Solirubrobacterales bacterium]
MVDADDSRPAAALPPGAASAGAEVRSLGAGRSVSAFAAGQTGWIVMHAEKVHVLTESFPGDLEQAVAAIRDDGAVRSAVLTGTSRVFCAGADISLAPRLRGPGFGRWWLSAHHDALESLAELPKPLVAAVNGAAAGAGFNLALACDVIVAAAGTSFSQAFIGIGLATDMGSLHLLPRRVGFQRARELMYTGRRIDAAEALEIGAVEEVVDPDDLIATARERAEALGAGPLRAFAAVKAGMDRADGTGLRESLAIELELQMDVLASGDFAEGTAAFLEKRAPEYEDGPGR